MLLTLTQHQAILLTIGIVAVVTIAGMIWARRLG